MAELKQFQRSRERITEILNELLLKGVSDERANRFIGDLQRSISVLDSKIEELTFEADGRKSHRTDLYN